MSPLGRRWKPFLFLFVKIVHLFIEIDSRSKCQYSYGKSYRASFTKRIGRSG